MRKMSFLLVMCLLFSCSFAGAADAEKEDAAATIAETMAQFGRSRKIRRKLEAGINRLQERSDCRSMGAIGTDVQKTSWQAPYS